MPAKTGGVIVKRDSGAYGATDSVGNPSNKGFKFASNNPKLLQFLTESLSAEERLRCVPLEGKEVALSQRYPYDLVTAILKGVIGRRFIPKKVYAYIRCPAIT